MVWDNRPLELMSHVEAVLMEMEQDELTDGYIKEKISLFLDQGNKLLLKLASGISTNYFDLSSFIMLLMSLISVNDTEIISLPSAQCIC